MKKKTSNTGRIAAKDLPPVKSWILPKVRGSHVVRSPFKEGDDAKKTKAPEEELIEPAPLTVEAVERIRKQAYEEGFQKGLADGLEQGEQQGRAKGEKLGFDTGMKRGEDEINRLREQFSALISAIQNPFQNQQQELEDAVLRLVTDTSLAVIKQELKTDPALLSQTVHEALAALPHGEADLSFTVNSYDQQQMESIRDQEHASWTVRIDDKLTPGSLLIKGANSYLDYSVENRFAQVVTQLLSQSNDEGGADGEV